MLVMNLVTPKAAAKLKLLFIKAASYAAGQFPENPSHT
jgi:hypothetical protein